LRALLGALVLALGSLGGDGLPGDGLFGILGLLAGSLQRGEHLEGALRGVGLRGESARAGERHDLLGVRRSCRLCGGRGPAQLLGGALERAGACDGVEQVGGAHRVDGAGEAVGLEPARPGRPGGGDAGGGFRLGRLVVLGEASRSGIERVAPCLDLGQISFVLDGGLGQLLGPHPHVAGLHDGRLAGEAEGGHQGLDGRIELGELGGVVCGRHGRRRACSPGREGERSGGEGDHHQHGGDGGGTGGERTSCAEASQHGATAERGAEERGRAVVGGGDGGAVGHDVSLRQQSDEGGGVFDGTP
jgi:hypothetical protein